MTVLALKRNVDTFTVQPGLVPVQKYSMHIMYFLWNAYSDATLFEKYRHIPPLHWSDTCWGRFYGRYVETILVLCTIAKRIRLKKISATHPDVRLDLFASWTVVKVEVVRYYYGSLLYSRLSKE